jgi:hypothetical protein
MGIGGLVFVILGIIIEDGTDGVIEDGEEIGGVEIGGDENGQEEVEIL